MNGAIAFTKVGTMESISYQRVERSLRMWREGGREGGRGREREREREREGGGRRNIEYVPGRENPSKPQRTPAVM